MPLTVDPEGRETEALRRIGPWRERRVLDIGCGDGRLSTRLARLGANVVAIDPDARLIRAARRSRPQDIAAKIHYRVGRAEHLPRRLGLFDAVVLSWSL
jgi:2-polyprenyl-3-methyl-5-hydroxy-6-metoxy-1,4-benzoquinol methylase